MTSNLYRMLAGAGLMLGMVPAMASAQQATTVSGRVTNEASAPVPGTSVSIKVLRKKWSEDKRKIELFMREAKLGMNLRHPNIVEILAVNHESDTKRAYGRLENTTFEGMMRAEAARGFRALSEVNADGRGFPLNKPVDRVAE